MQQAELLRFEWKLRWQYPRSPNVASAIVVSIDYHSVFQTGRRECKNANCSRNLISSTTVSILSEFDFNFDNPTYLHQELILTFDFDWNIWLTQEKNVENGFNTMMNISQEWNEYFDWKLNQDVKQIDSLESLQFYNFRAFDDFHYFDDIDDNRDVPIIGCPESLADKMPWKFLPNKFSFVLFYSEENSPPFSMTQVNRIFHSRNTDWTSSKVRSFQFSVKRRRRSWIVWNSRSFIFHLAIPKNQKSHGIRSGE
jgi:hypothetical protein